MSLKAKLPARTLTGTGFIAATTAAALSLLYFTELVEWPSSYVPYRGSLVSSSPYNNMRSVWIGHELIFQVLSHANPLLVCLASSNLICGMGSPRQRRLVRYVSSLWEHASELDRREGKLFFADSVRWNQSVSSITTLYFLKLCRVKLRMREGSVRHGLLA